MSLGDKVNSAGEYDLSCSAPASLASLNQDSRTPLYGPDMKESSGKPLREGPKEHAGPKHNWTWCSVYKRQAVTAGLLDYVRHCLQVLPWA